MYYTTFSKVKSQYAKYIKISYELVNFMLTWEGIEMTLENSKENNKTVAFLTLGCKVNSYETEAMERLFVEKGYKVIDFSDGADVYVINTCTVTNIADRKSRQMLHRARKQNPDAVVVAAGCYVQASKETLEADGAIDIIVGNNQKQNIVSIVEGYFKDKNNREAVININSEKKYEELSIESVREKVRVYIKIQDGCNQFCSYCIIPYARGRVRSRNAGNIIKEVEKLVNNGYKEIVLTGIHLSSYGIDFEEEEYGEWLSEEKETPLLSLILRLCKIEGLERIRLGSLEPRIITEKFAGILSQEKKICPHFHLSLQSGCMKTLKRMNRMYTPEEYYEKCEILRKYFFNPAITTDVIVGFPGETEEEFEECKAFLEKIAFAQMHIFKYSRRKGTRAEKMPAQVTEQDKNNRSDILIKLESKLREKYISSFIGKEANILIEESINIDGERYWIGHNERYLKLAVKDKNVCENQILRVKIKEKLTDEIICCEIMD